MVARQLSFQFFQGPLWATDCHNNLKINFTISQETPGSCPVFSENHVYIIAGPPEDLTSWSLPALPVLGSDDPLHVFLLQYLFSLDMDECTVFWLSSIVYWIFLYSLLDLNLQEQNIQKVLFMYIIYDVWCLTEMYVDSRWSGLDVIRLNLASSVLSRNHLQFAHFNLKLTVILYHYLSTYFLSYPVLLRSCWGDSYTTNE